jgi:hypothetical protein
MVKMGFVLVYERAECRSCRWFTGRLSMEERLRLPPSANVEAIGRCKHKIVIILRNNGAPTRHCPTAERHKKPKKE